MANSLNWRWLKPLAWSLVVLFLSHPSYGYIMAKMNDDQLASYLDYVVQMAGNQNRPPSEVRALILLKAKELDVPVLGEQIRISGDRRDLKVSLSYGVDILIPGLERVLYHKVFSHQAAYHSEL